MRVLLNCCASDPIECRTSSLMLNGRVWKCLILYVNIYIIIHICTYSFWQFITLFKIRCDQDHCQARHSLPTQWASILQKATCIYIYICTHIHFLCPHRLIPHPSLQNTTKDSSRMFGAYWWWLGVQFIINLDTVEHFRFEKGRGSWKEASARKARTRQEHSQKGERGHNCNRRME